MPEADEDKKQKDWREIQREKARQIMKEGRLGEFIDWATVIRGLVTIAIIVLLVVFWGSIVDSLAGVLKDVGFSIQSQAEAALVANYLLLGLIVVTVFVEAIPYVVSWLNRPKIKLLSLAHSNSGYLRVREVGKEETKVNLRIVYADLWNDGRSPALNPVVIVSHTEYEAPKVFGVAKEEAVWIDKQITPLPANVYDTEAWDELAIRFMEMGMKKVAYIPAHHDGKRFLIGFAFEGSDGFYYASMDSAFLDKVKFGRTQYVHIGFHARNSKKKIFKMNIPAEFPSWDKVKFNYRSVEGPRAEESTGPSVSQAPSQS